MILPKLRHNLNTMPSPDPQQPGLFIRDHFRYSESWLIVPPKMVPGLHFFDGAHTAQDLEAEFRRHTSEADAAAAARQLIEALDGAGFLDNATFAQMRESGHRAFAESPVRKALHAGSGYPENAAALRDFLDGFLAGAMPEPQRGTLGIAAPHVSPGGGRESYGAAYRMLTPDLKDRTFVILGTSHYGQPNRFGLTRKPFETPLGATRTAPALLDALAAQPAVVMEDYCQSIEHSIEFQVVFLQHVYGPDVKILPLLCGPFFQSIYNGGNPEDDELLRRFFATLNEIATRDAGQLFWVLGVDMAHIGVRYGDAAAARAGQEQMIRVKERDHGRIASINAGDAHGFWEQVQENHDDLRWCGSSPLYTFMQAVPGALGTLQHYEQWNIDAQSVVSFSGISFAKT